MKYGGKKRLVAEIAIAKVTRVPRSAKTMRPICLEPHLPMIFSSVWTVVTPVSFMFQIEWAARENLSKMFFIMVKKRWTIGLLKLVARAKLVTSSFRSDKLTCHLKKYAN